MNRSEYLALLRQALSAPHGVALQFDDWVKADRARGRLYRLRSNLRRAGDHSFDNLSFVMQPYGGLWIVRRDRLPRRDRDDGLSAESRHLRPEELPRHFGFCNDTFAIRKPK